MTLSIWRYAHLSLAILSSAFLVILSITGVILAVDAINEKSPAYKVENFDNITLAQVLPTLREHYFEIIEVKVDHNDFVTIDAMDEDGNSIKSYIDPTTGKKIGEIVPKSDFINWVTALHRSLFLKETGRAIVGVVSFLLMLISISGLILIVKRQQGILNFFTKVNKDSFSQYFHVVTGRWLLIPVLIIALTGTLIFLARLEPLVGQPKEIEHQVKENLQPKDLKDIEFFKNTKLSSVEKIEFPFIPDDEAEPFIVHLRKKSVSVNQVNGTIISESLNPYSAIVEKFNIDLHTGRTNVIWAAILGIASLNILFFIWSGFVITFKRTKTKIGKNKYKANEAEIILLVGSENGATVGFASKIQEQFLANGKKSFIAQMNQYEIYPKAKQLIIFTSTYGIGDAPANAKKFEQLITQFPQNQSIEFSVVGFGSRAYSDYCGYAVKVDKWLNDQKWATQLLDLKTVNDKSPEEFTNWVIAYKETTDIPLATTPAMYVGKALELKNVKVISTTKITQEDAAFKVILDVKEKFKSGDLLAIYPESDHKERLYSVGKVDNKLQLIVKLHEFGLGSQYLYNLVQNSTIKARIVKNKAFRFPKASKVVMIANGTGIAPFLGMIDENSKNIETHLYCGFRHDNETTKSYQEFATKQIFTNHLSQFHIAFSREENKQYVMDLVNRDAKFFAETLQNGGILMICGALTMQHDVEKVLEQICQEHLNKSFEEFKTNGQFLTDCY
ncbi:PepSY domain-containing protein [Empedobacter falsenii]|uniref:FAD-binding oxidoreductase n=1 Tax=Empedobacter falsenii TaxID=343874 RepID=A0A427BNQ4_9FLAO|nr:PepSY domain-containing protein [Empedobacter falsenii]RRT91445.1 FAD-binding oxidoreductase [Empedobacter falsenii]RRT91498.1 FAD-binding oxidoreductase [Empedobacter falsenii]